MIWPSTCLIYQRFAFIFQSAAKDLFWDNVAPNNKVRLNVYLHVSPLIICKELSRSRRQSLAKGRSHHQSRPACQPGLSPMNACANPSQCHLQKGLSRKKGKKWTLRSCVKWRYSARSCNQLKESSEAISSCPEMPVMKTKEGLPLNCLNEGIADAGSSFCNLRGGQVQGPRRE